jgi:galactokinase
MNTSNLQKRFEALYHRPAAGAVAAPGRVNLIGEHTDYNDGFVLPIAIERQTVALCAPRTDRQVHLASLNQEQAATIDLAAPIRKAEPRWANYCRGVAAGLVARGVKISGADILFESDVPLGGGLSSSASLEVATGFALLAAADLAGSVADRDLALICQKAEHEFAGAPCGIMDQSISIMGREGHALLLDCRDGGTKQIPFNNPGVVLLVADTQVKHAINDGGYAARRDQCYAAAKKLGVRMLRETGAEEIVRAERTGALAGVELMRARHVVGEIGRTLAACEALTAGDYEEFGRLMYGSHESLRDDYEVSCEELDAVVELARASQGVYGARMTGGGFGGCAILLVEAERAEIIAKGVAAGFARRFGRSCPIFATRAAAGARKLDLT